MFGRTLLRTALVAGLFGLSALVPLAAKNVSMSTGQLMLSFTVPDNWKSTQIERGLEIKSNDEEIFLWVEAYREADLEKVKAEHAKYFTKQGVKFTGEPKIHAEATERYGLAFMDMPATWNGNPTVLRYIFIEPADAKKRRLMMSYWASPEGDKKHSEAMGALVKSLGAAVDATH
jgi:hypothetical protein